MVNKRNLEILKGMVKPEEVAKFLKLDDVWGVFNIQDDILYGILYRIIQGKALTANAEMALLKAQDKYQTKSNDGKYFDAIQAHLSMNNSIERLIRRGGIRT